MDIAATVRYAGWASVPDRVAMICRACAPLAKLARQVSDVPGEVYAREDGKVVRVVGDPRLREHFQAAGIQVEGAPYEILIKRAAPLGGLGAAWDTVVGAAGGPRALTTTLAGSLLTGGLGYGAGAMLEKLFPERYVERGRLRKTLGLAGAGLGAVPGIWQATANHRNAAAAGQPISALRSLTIPSDEVPLNPKMAAILATLADVPIDPSFYKLAFHDDTGAMGLPIVPVDAFNRAVWNDVRAGASRYNPYGTQDPWGTGPQTLHTPPELGAATTGLMSGIQQMHGGTRMLRPTDVVRGIASAGVGLATANITGRALSALAGLSPPAQAKLQDLGIWAGVLSAVVPPLFGR